MDKGNPTVVLLTQGGSRTIIACARSLNEDDIDFIICKQNGENQIPWGMTKYRNKVYDKKIAHTSNSNQFKSDLKNIVEEINNDVMLFPLSDEMLKDCYCIYDWISNNNNIIFPLPNQSVYKKLSNKKELVNLCRKMNITVPQEYKSISEVDGRPFVAKPKIQFNEDGYKYTPQLIYNKKQENNFKSNYKTNNFFYQDFVEGENRWIFFHVRKDGEIKNFAQKIIIQQPNGGSTIKASPIEVNKDIIQKLTTLLESVGWRGIVMFEMIKTEKGDHVMIESNPRFWGPLQLCIDNNVNFPQMLYLDHSESYSRNRFSPKRSHGYIRYEALFVGIWQRLAGRGPIQKNMSEPNYVYHDIWARRDTFFIFMYTIFKSLVRPITHLVNKITG